MGNFRALAAAAASIEQQLTACFQAERAAFAPRVPKAQLVRTEDLSDTSAVITRPSLSILVYRVDFNKAMRAAWSGVGSIDGNARLALDMHFVITPWHDNAEDELLILGRAMQCLEATPILSGPQLQPTAGWATNEAVQLVVEDVPTDSIIRIYDSLPTDFRLSVPYVARVLRVDSQDPDRVPDVVTALTHVTNRVEPPS